MATHTYSASSWLFRRLLGLSYLFAFWSLAQQLPGLIGHDGILPAQDFLRELGAFADAAGIGLDRYRLTPTLAWFASSDTALVAGAWSGVALSSALVAGLAPGVLLPLLWLLWLSFVVIGGDWLSYQWDALLLETGLIATLLAPWGWWDRLRAGWDPPWIARALLWWLLFRLMFASGVVKLASGDPTWRDLTAMAVHFETQPLPTPLAWYVAQFPSVVHRAMTAGVLAIELVVPLLIVCGARARRLAAIGLVALQVLIAVTGNYAYFNLLTAALCVTLIDDQMFGSRVAVTRDSPRVAVLPAGIAAAVLLPVSVTVFANQFGTSVPALQPLVSWVRPFGSTNAYGLFAVMTTTRPEIVVEGSADGVRWEPYEFRHQPGALDHAPTWIAPFQPRLDWQLWFAALGRYDEEIWFQRFCQRLLEGSKPVSALLAVNPFPDTPPRFVRSTLYNYRFANAADGRWWTRERLGAYGPTLPRAPVP